MCYSEDYVDDLKTELETTLEDNRRLRFALEAFASTAEEAVAAHCAPKTGMQVPFHGDFACTTPSTIGRLRWWARQFRHVLSGKDWNEK